MSAAVGQLQRYVVGFALDDVGRVALIEKNRPDWQAGLLNGIGGHVESGEVPADAMVREFEEETGVRIEGWEPFVHMVFPGAVIDFYRIRIHHDTMDALRTTTDEQVRRVPLTMLNARLPHVPNLSWLVPLAAYTADTYEPVRVVASVAETLADTAPTPGPLDPDPVLDDALAEDMAARQNGYDYATATTPDEPRHVALPAFQCTGCRFCAGASR